MTDKQNIFNRIGKSHCNEILHLAREHPAQEVIGIFNDFDRKQTLSTSFHFSAISDIRKPSQPKSSSQDNEREAGYNSESPHDQDNRPYSSSQGGQRGV